MSALVLERLTKSAGLTSARCTHPVKANVKVLKGGMVAIDSAGRAMPAGAASGGSVVALGKASATINNLTGSELGGAAGAADVEIECGIHYWENSASSDEIAADDVGLPCYVVDDQTVALTSSSGTRIIAGIIKEVTAAGKVGVLQSPEAWAIAQAAALAAAGISVQKRTVTVGHADLTDADTSQDINIGAVLPANARIIGVDMRALTAFAGGTVSALAVDIGTSGDVDALIDGADLFTAAVDGGPATMPLGIRHNKTFATAGAQLSARFVSTGDNLVNLTAGSVIIDVLFAVLA
jgi:hypothetical protein